MVDRPPPAAAGPVRPAARPRRDDAGGPPVHRRRRTAHGWPPFLGLAIVLSVAATGLVASEGRGPGPGQAEARQLHLTWPRDPRWTVTIQWHTTTSTSNLALVAGPDGRWRTRYGRRPAQRAVTTGRLHQVEVTGLRADTEYRYAVATDAGMSRPYSFRTAPRGPASFRFAAFGDQGDCLTHRPACKVIKQIAEEDPAFVLGAGAGALSSADADGPAAEERWLQDVSLYASRAPLMPTPGHHEDPAGPAAEHQVPLSDLQAHFAIPGLTDPGHYSFDYGGLHVVALPDAYGQHPGGADRALLSWLDADLAAARADRRTRWIVAFLHRPLYSTGRRQGAYAPFTRDLVPLFDRHRVDVVVSGHEDHYERTLPMRAGVKTFKTLGVVPSGTGTVYVVSGGGGAPVVDDVGPRAPWDAVRSAVHQHLLFEVTPRLLQMSAVTTSRHVVDQLVLDRTD